MKKTIITSIISIVSFVMIGLAIFFIFKPIELKTEKRSSTSLIQEKIVELSELATLKYEYSDVVVSRTNRKISLGVTDLKFAEAIKLIKYSGYLKAGTDLSKASVSYNKEKNLMLVRVPKARILDNVAEIEKAEVEDVKGNILSDYPTQTVFDVISKNKEKVEKKKISEGLLEKADQSTQKLLTSFLKSNEYKNISIEFY
ncbi:DUF4230 domain-containing protein [Exiguobacterium acetylicum]|uniref:DUF4230 domain-containing protein n=1 Tax=Exiguobacterium acetylicum TaxID=41170 RepID=UPI0010581033|nr:DUF4230 domain-containing protein [Exiguobacterium acetylicum]UKS56072.1 DUF4230 domain-containing protein [Exiguobacterium acetylicum]